MKNTTFENRTRGINKTSKGYQIAKALLTGSKKEYTCHTSGSGRFTTNLDYNCATIEVLECAGLVENKDFTTGNESPRGGLTGQFIEMTSRGRNKGIKY